MTELLKKKLSFPSTFVQLQALNQLSSAIRSKLQTSRNSPSELEILWQYCANVPSRQLGYACANALVKLAEDGLLDIDNVVTMAVNLSATANDKTILVHIIGLLMKLQVFDHLKRHPGVSFRSPYDLRSCPHPFISVLKSGANSWRTVDIEIAQMLLDCVDADCFSTMVVALRPAILYVTLKGKLSKREDVVPAILEALIVKYTSGKNTGGNEVETLLHHIFDYYEPNSVTISTFEKFALSDLGARNILFHTHYMLKLQNCIVKCTSFYDTGLALNSMNRILDHCADKSIDGGVIVIGFCTILNRVNLQVVPNLLNSVTKFLTQHNENLRPVHLNMLKVSLLQLKFVTSVITNDLGIIGLVGTLLKIMLNFTFDCTKYDASPASAEFNSTSSVFVAEAYHMDYTVRSASDCDVICESWLDGIEKSAVNKQMDGCDVDKATISVSTLLLQLLYDCTRFSHGLFTKILNTVAKIGGCYSRASFQFLPILLHSMSITDETAVVDVLLTLPHLASHPNCVAPILNVIKGIGTSSDYNLKAISLRMMVELWKVQGRCFPYLLSALYSPEAHTVKKITQDHSVKITKAAVVAFVCKERPHQHGSDMLKLIENMLSRKLPTAALAYVLEGLYNLCVNKVLKLLTITEMVTNILQSGPDIVVVKIILKTLSLLSSCDTSDAGVEPIINNVVTEIWKLVGGGNSCLADEAFGCLSKFDAETFRIKHLPLTFRPAKSDEDTDEEYLNTVIPYCQYLTIARRVDCIGQPGCSSFLITVLRQELENLPRGIHHKAIKSQLASTQPKAAKSIPDFVASAYGKNKKPGLKASLAFSMLLSQNSAAESCDLDNAAKKLAIIEGRKVLDNIHVMLKEITIEPNSWQDLIRCAQGWVAFMKKSMMVMASGRRLEIEMQKSDDQEEKEHRIKTAVLWCRDKIINALKNASKNSPSMQGNAILGLTGLLIAVEQFNDDEQRVDEHTEYVSMAHWSVMVLDTIITIACPGHVPSGRLLSWCQYRAISSTGRLCTTQVGRLCAIHALPFCLSSLSQARLRKVNDIIKSLKECIADDKQLEFHRQISLGNALNVLIKEQSEDNSNALVSEYAVEAIYGNMLESVQKLVNSHFDLQNDLGCIVGWGLAATVRFSKSTHDCESEKVLWTEFLQILKTGDISPDALQVISTVVTWLCLHGCVRGLVSSAESHELLRNLVELTDEVPNKSGFSDSLGTLCCGMLLNGDKDVSDTMDKLYTQWFGVLDKSNVPTREKFAALTGLSSLCGASASLFSMPVDPAMLTAVQYLSKLSGSIKILKHLHTSSDVGTQGKSSVYLGCLNLFFQNNVHNSSFILPSTYNYLSKSSLLRNLFDLLADGVTHSSNVASKHRDTYMYCLVESSRNIAMPPVNWGNALNSVLLNSTGTEAKIHAIHLVLSQCERSSACSALLCKCTSSKIFADLPVQSRSMIYTSLGKLYKCAKEGDFVQFLQTKTRDLMCSNTSEQLGVRAAFMSGLKNLLIDIENLSPLTLEAVKDCTVKIFLLAKFSIHSHEDVAMMTDLAFICRFTDQKVSNFMDMSPASHVALKSLFVVCCESLKKKQPSGSCSETIMACSRHIDIHDAVVWIVSGYALQMKEMVKSSVLSDWIKELMNMTMEARCELKEFGPSLDYFVVLITSLISTCFTNEIPNFGKFGMEPAHPEVLRFFKHLCRHIFPTTVEIILGKPSYKDVTESLVAWSNCILEKYPHYGYESEWNESLLTAIGIYKEQEDKLLPSTWCQMIEVVYRPVSQCK